MGAIAFESAHHVKVEYEVASTFQRVAAFAIDTTAFFIYFIVISFSFGLANFFESSGMEEFIWLLIVKLPWILYHPIMEYFTAGQSLGKLALGIRLVNLNGERPGLKEVFTRWLFRGDFLFISTDLFALLWFGFGLIGTVFSATSPLHQRLGDRMAGTIVIKNKSNTQYRLSDILAIQTLENYEPTYPMVTKLTDEDMLLIKNAIQRVVKSPNDESKRFAIQLADESARLIGLEATPPKRMEFLQTLLKDYIVLTR
ncbi:MAG: RDD family protein [Bacteroidota bacterium]